MIFSVVSSRPFCDTSWSGFAKPWPPYLVRSIGWAVLQGLLGSSVWAGAPALTAVWPAWAVGATGAGAWVAGCAAVACWPAGSLPLGAGGLLAQLASSSDSSMAGSAKRVRWWFIGFLLRAKGVIGRRVCSGAAPSSFTCPAPQWLGAPIEARRCLRVLWSLQPAHLSRRRDAGIVAGVYDLEAILR